MDEEISAQNVVPRLFYYGVGRFAVVLLIASVAPIALYHMLAGAVLTERQLIMVFMLWATVILLCTSIYALCYYRSLRTAISPVCRLASSAIQTAAIAHDVRGPLTSIQVAVRHLRDMQGEHGANFGQCVELLEKSTSRLTRVAEEFLEQQEAVAQHNMHSLIEALVGEYEARLDLSDIHFTTQLDAEHPHVEGQVRRVERVLSNVIKNAIEAMEFEGGISITTSIHADEQLQITIADNGPGMSADLLERVRQGRATSKRRGHGIGLQFAQQVMREHAGHLSVDSRLGEGTAVTLRLPAVHVAHKIVALRQPA